MTKRAAIYIRVSTERQSERISPEAQERDCRAYCEQRSYTVIEVYRDVEKYRVGRRLVEPSGTRADRPQLKRMLADAGAGKLDVIIAWREDRLYRSYRPMLDVLDCIERNKIDVELVKETFDRKLAPVKAWAARMELDAKHDRYMMGIAGRLAKGKAGNNHEHYGYKNVEGVYRLEPAEAEWVVKIWQWYADGIMPKEIRRRLIENNAPQRNKSDEKPAWQYSFIRKILKADCYHIGKVLERWGGEVYEIPVPVIIDTETAQLVADRNEKNKVHPAHNLKYQYLASGKVYCAACKTKVVMSTLTHYAGGKPRNKPYTQCRCRYAKMGYARPGCFVGASLAELEAKIWEKVWAVISDDEKFQQLVQAKVTALKAEEIDAAAEVERLTQRLDDLMMERQKIINWALKGVITETDMEMKLGALSVEEAELKRELQEKSLFVGNRAERLIALVNEVRAGLRQGAEFLNGMPTTPEFARRQFELRKKVMDTIVAQIDVHTDKSVTVHLEFDLSGLIDNDASPA